MSPFIALLFHRKYASGTSGIQKKLINFDWFLQNLGNSLATLAILSFLSLNKPLHRTKIMTPETYRKVFTRALTRTLLAATVLLSSLVTSIEAANAEAPIDDDRLTSYDLVEGQSSQSLAMPSAKSDISSAAQSHATVSNLTRRSLSFHADPIARLSKPSVSLESLLASIPVRNEAAANKTALSETETSAIEISATELVIDSSSTQVVQLAQDLGDSFAPDSPADLRQRLLIDPDAQFDPTVPVDSPKAVPSSTFLVPSAYGADWGDTYAGLAGSTGSDRDRSTDGSAAIGIGFGDAVRNIGVEVGVGIISLDGFADDGIVGFKLHKIFPQAGNLAVAAGWTNPIKWGNANNAEDTFYGVATKQFRLRPNASNQMPLTASLGVGTGTFRSVGAIDADDNGVNVFGSAGLRIIPQVSVISSWNGTGLGLATSIVPIRRLPWVLTLGASDVTGNTDEGAQFQGSFGYGIRF